MNYSSEILDFHLQSSDGLHIKLTDVTSDGQGDDAKAGTMPSSAQTQEYKMADL